MSNSKTIRVRLENLQVSRDSVTIPLYDDGDHYPLNTRQKSYAHGGDCHLWINGDAEVCVYAQSEEILYPLFYGRTLDQTYNFDAAVTHVVIKSAAEEGTFAWRCIFHGVRFREANSGIPKTLPVKLDDTSFQNRVMNAVYAALDARGLSGAGPGKGRAYSTPDDETHEDEEFGSGYSYDESVEEEIETAAAKAVAERLKPRVHRGESAGASAESLPDDDTGGDTPAAPSRRRQHPGDPINPGARRDAAPTTKS